jgi:hypothetical protein
MAYNNPCSKDIYLFLLRGIKMSLFDEINSIMQEKNPQFVIVPGHGRVAVGSEIWVTRPGYGKVLVKVTAGMGQRCN